MPILGEIPILAFAFTSKTYVETEEELIILVTPHLIDPMACNQIPKYLPGRETRSADDFELFLEGILEAPRGQRTIEHPYRAAYLNGASPYPCGDASGLRGARCGPAGCSNAGCSNTGLAPNPGSSGNPPASPGLPGSAMYRNAQPVDTDSDTRSALVTVVGNDTGPDPSPAVFTPGVLMQPR
jgi:pilus assembly protein CpaC